MGIEHNWLMRFKRRTRYIDCLKETLVLFATTHTIPQPYEVLSIVSSTFDVDRGVLGRRNVTKYLTQANKELGEKANKLGGNGVIGIRYTPISDTMLLVTGTAVRLTS